MQDASLDPHSCPALLRACSKLVPPAVPLQITGLMPVRGLPLLCGHLWQDRAATEVHTIAKARQLLVDLDPALFPITGLHHWAHLQLAPLAHLPYPHPHYSLNCCTHICGETVQPQKGTSVNRTPQLLVSQGLALSPVSGLHHGS